MKITRIETLVCHARMRNWIFVKVDDRPTGPRLAGVRRRSSGTRARWSARSRIWPSCLIGEDPTRVEHLWQMMYRQHFWHGNGASAATAIAGIDLALVGYPRQIARLCRAITCGAGACRDYIRLYCHLGGGKMEDFYETKPEDAKRFADLARAVVADGFTAFKSMAVPEQLPLEGIAPVKYAAACVAAMREAVGDRIDIMVDCHARPSPRMGLLFAKALEPYGLYFFEEPCWPEHMDGIAEIQRAVSTPIATGERLTSFYAFKELFEKRAASVVQPDITHCGGLTAARRIAAMAEARVSRRAAQSAGAGEHRGLDRVRLRHTQLPDLRSGAPGCAVAQRGCERVFYRRSCHAHRASRYCSRTGHRTGRGRDSSTSF